MREFVRASQAETGPLTFDARVSLVDALGSIRSECGLTRRECDILRLTAFGSSRDELPDRLGIGRRTVKYHITNLLQKIHRKRLGDAGLRAWLVALGLEPKMLQETGPRAGDKSTEVDDSPRGGGAPCEGQSSRRSGS